MHCLVQVLLLCVGCCSPGFATASATEQFRSLNGEGKIDVCARKSSGGFVKRTIPVKRYEKKMDKFKLPGDELRPGRFLDEDCKRVNCERKCKRDGNQCFLSFSESFECECQPCSASCPGDPSIIDGEICDVTLQCSYGEETCCGKTHPSFTVSTEKFVQ